MQNRFMKLPHTKKNSMYQRSKMGGKKQNVFTHRRWSRLWTEEGGSRSLFPASRSFSSSSLSMEAIDEFWFWNPFRFSLKIVILLHHFFSIFFWHFHCLIFFSNFNILKRKFNMISYFYIKMQSSTRLNIKNTLVDLVVIDVELGTEDQSLIIHNCNREGLKPFNVTTDP
jgi:hypothetical protein